mmetsp:Transcript_42896/g.48729  ORF Transcript_42896/g.48729 Transcript_42896/m.48729 type:complete len:291 (+) Transcript_42896:191-1063(+)|eukprot:CAMPEP_0194131904 /NCGR_PEP_ID=MMETSP0152-20130528/2525_1 /TAXON_ID=1049557 /ORGANISM="Thalassiothrix antarctica, Strain L6-D1" /LENGTH=290 /DNA_ID=CAMNT_0038826793 /DNA_START=155 /DNA_END=1027 /DNA_ORIENTATION=+
MATDKNVDNGMKNYEEESWPSTLSGVPTRSLVAPGQCQLTSQFVAVPLLQRWDVSSTSSVLRFGPLPNPDSPLNLSTCACILAMAHVPHTVIRPYTPISTNAQVGSFDLLVKDYGETGVMSNYLCKYLQPGHKVMFKHIEFNVKIQAPFPFTKIAMIVGGTGITPMIQAMHAVLGKESDRYQISMLYGSRTSTDILGKDLLDVWSSSDSRFSVTHVLSNELEDSDWDGARGFINEELITKHFPSPDDASFKIFVCGPPPMYNALCGPRTQKELTGLLSRMGYNAKQVFKF